MTASSLEKTRKWIWDQCKGLSPEFVSDLSRVICLRFLDRFKAQGNSSSEELLSQKFLLKSPAVALYKALPTEICLDQLEDYFVQKNWKLYFPRVVDRESLEFVEMEAPHLLSQWKKGRFGITEPHDEVNKVVDLKEFSEKLDLVFVPGVAFGEKGERLGKGMGHYDRFLTHVPHALRVVLAFDFQVLPQLEQRAWDQSVHWIITEKREFRTPKVDSWFKNRTSGT